MGVFSRSVDRDEKGNLKAAPYSEPRTITAAAVPINISDKTELSSLSKRRAASAWQDQAWEYYDLIGEIKFSANFLASVVSRVRLFGGYIKDDDLAPTVLKNMEGIDDDLVVDVQRIMRRLGSGNGGVPGLLQDASLNLFISGECYLVQEPGRPGNGNKERWSCRSVKEMVFRKGKNAGTFIKPSKSTTTSEMIQLPNRAAVQRIWRMHPAYSDDADSSMLGLLELCDELLLLNKASRGAAKSQTNAGLITVPDSLSNSSQSDGEIDDDEETMADLSDDDTDAFEDEFIQALITPISDEGAASSVAPLLVRGPGDELDHIRHIPLDRKFDETSANRADKVLDRILGGLDIPKEIVQGIADAKYANAVQVEETLYKAHIEPMVLLLCDALTEAFLHPMLKALGWKESDYENIVIWYDPSAITAKPSKAEAASVGYDKKILSAQAWRRANGFSESDAPTELEVVQRLGVERGIIPEPINNAILATLVPDLMKQVQQQQQAASPDGGAVAQQISAQEPTAPAQKSEEPPTSEIPPEDVPPVPLIEP